MDKENQTSVPETAGYHKKDVKRSSSYPAMTVVESYDFVAKINAHFSAAVEITREEAAVAFNLHPNTMSRSFASAVQYGFLERNEGKYKVSRLFVEVFQPESEKDKKLGLISAFGKPKLFQELIKKFDGNVIPQELPNTLIRHHGITEQASTDAADTFIKSAMEVGVLNESRILRYQVTFSSVAKTQYAEIIEEQPKEQINTGSASNTLVKVVEPANYIGENDIKVPIHLTKNKMAYMVYPSNINNNDIKLLDHAIKGILLRLELEKDEGNGSPSPGD